MKKLMLLAVLLTGMVLVQGCSKGYWLIPKHKTLEEAVEDYTGCVNTTEFSYVNPRGVLIDLGDGKGVLWVNRSYVFKKCMEDMLYTWTEDYIEGFEWVLLDPQRVNYQGFSGYPSRGLLTSWQN